MFGVYYEHNIWQVKTQDNGYAVNPAAVASVFLYGQVLR